MKKSFKVAYVGLTHLGLNYLAASSEKGFEIVGVDINQNKIDKLNQFIKIMLYEFRRFLKIIIVMFLGVLIGGFLLLILSNIALGTTR